MPRKGPRPHTWKVQGDLPHQQHIAWHRMRAQAIYRGEIWELDFEDFQTIWGPHWDQRGRGADQYCMTRMDPSLSWNPSNTIVLKRIDHLRQHTTRQRNGFYTSLKKGDRYGEEDLRTKTKEY